MKTARPNHLNLLFSTWSQEQNLDEVKRHVDTLKIEGWCKDWLGRMSWSRPFACLVRQTHQKKTVQKQKTRQIRVSVHSLPTQLSDAKRGLEVYNVHDMLGLWWLTALHRYAFIHYCNRAGGFVGQAGCVGARLSSHSSALLPGVWISPNSLPQRTGTGITV